MVAGVDLIPAVIEVEMTAAQSAYERVKELIITLQLPPGSTIREPDLQHRLGIGRTPLREALHRLANEHMLHIYPRRTMIVAILGMEESWQVFEMRLAVETAAAGLAALRASASDLDEAASIGCALDECRGVADATRFLRADQRFHQAIGRYARNTFLREAIDHVQALNVWLWQTYFSTHAAEADAMFTHDAILAALAARDAPGAEAAMRAHILASRKQLLTGYTSVTL